MFTGIDVSTYQGRIDWRAVGQAGISFAWAKATQGTAHVDNEWANNAMSASPCVKFNGYHFADPGNPQAQARHFVATLGGYASGGAPTIRPMLDVETHGIDANWVLAFADTFKSLTGYDPILYTYLAFLRSDLGNDPRLTSRFLLDIARLGAPGNPGVSPWAVHQYSWTGRVPGIGGNVDMDVAPSLNALLIPTATPPTTPPTRRSDEDMIPFFDGKTHDGAHLPHIVLSNDGKFLVALYGAPFDPKSSKVRNLPFGQTWQLHAPAKSIAPLRSAPDQPGAGVLVEFADNTTGGASFVAGVTC